MQESAQVPSRKLPALRAGGSFLEEHEITEEPLVASLLLVAMPGAPSSF